MVIKPMIRNNICMNAHPVGCFKDVENQIAYVKSQGTYKGPKRALVIGSSTGYGLASRISLAYGAGAATLGVSFEKEPTETKVGTMGWYNTEAFEKLAKEAGLVSESLNADAFSHATRAQVIDRIKALFGQVDMVVYSIASPVRVNPDNPEQMWKSVLKPLGTTFTDRSVNMMTGEVKEASIEATQDAEEIAQTIKVMGGEDWELWIDALLKAGVLAPNAVTVAYSYIGPEVTFAVYRDGTIGKAKEHLEGTVASLDKKLAAIGGKSYVSENKGLVTRASAVIPVVPLYFSLLYKIMKEKNIHEDCIMQMHRMMKDKIFAKGNGVKNVPVDSEGRIRMDDWELREDVQAEVSKLWSKVNTENVYELTDLKGCFQDFLHIHGFGHSNVDYEADVSTFFPKS